MRREYHVCGFIQLVYFVAVSFNHIWSGRDAHVGKGQSGSGEAGWRRRRLCRACRVELEQPGLTLGCAQGCAGAAASVLGGVFTRARTHTHPHSEMLGGPSVLWASPSSSPPPPAVFMPTGRVPSGCGRACPQASELGPGPGSGSGSGPELLV